MDRIIALAETAAMVGMVAGAYVAIIGVVWKMSAHTSDRNHHPDAEHLVYRDTCEAKREAMKTGIGNNGDRIRELKEYMQDEFKEIKSLIKDGSR